MKLAFLFSLFSFSIMAANNSSLQLRGVVQKSFSTTIKETNSEHTNYTIESFINNDQKVKIFISKKDEKFVHLKDVALLKNKKIQTISPKKNGRSLPSHVTINIMNN
ncbi:hypothetical protein M899_0829 [Bacteriovorax sp. BSW11_IV]|nr:hypothetical protein M899_0829 [Bacteriovorax sp. BSW11_IV]